MSGSGDASGLAAELREEVTLTIQAAQRWHPRSQQQAIGPSEAGGPCGLKLAYKLARHPRVRDDDMSWRATVGTSVHRWLERTFGRVALPDGSPRWLLEQRILCGHVDGQELWGTADAYDTTTGTVIDWKVVSAASLKRMRSGGVGSTYRVQRQLYGLGLTGAGHPVTHVGNVLLPSAGELSDLHVDIEPFDLNVALQALGRVNRIAEDLGALDLPEAFARQERAEDWCVRSCPWWRPGSTDLVLGCPGAKPADPKAVAGKQLAGILPA